MSQDSLDRLLAGRFPNPDGPGPLSVPTRQVLIADSLAGQEAALVAGLTLGRRLAVVCDARTQAALGARVTAALEAAGPVEAVVLDGEPHADDRTAAAVRARTATCEALVAVGSGTINDLCKYAAHLDGKPYAVFPTAPSMNGYTSANAAITEDGHKRSLPATSAVAVFADLAVLAAAPPRLIRSGLGDSACRPTAQTDWLLSHLLLGTPYREAPFALLAEDEAELLARPEALLAGDLSAMRRLVRTLMLSGFGMTICGGSQPASQGEHLISHYLEMLGDPAWPPPYHGEQIAVTTLTMARLQERMLAGGPPALAPETVDEAALAAHFGRDLGRSCWRQFATKARLDAAALGAHLARIWPETADRLARVSRPGRVLADVLRRAGAPTAPADLGVPPVFYRTAVLHAREIRDRYTFLDLAAAAGVLDAFAVAESADA